jgi:hypothetical protein
LRCWFWDFQLLAPVSECACASGEPEDGAGSGPSANFNFGLLGITRVASSPRFVESPRNVLDELQSVRVMHLSLDERVVGRDRMVGGRVLV